MQKERRTQRIETALVPGGGLEPPRLSTPDPKSGASTNSATRARIRKNALKKQQGQDFSQEKTMRTGLTTGSERVPERSLPKPEHDRENGQNDKHPLQKSDIRQF